MEKMTIHDSRMGRTPTLLVARGLLISAATS
jgi:hypothetical protein